MKRPVAVIVCSLFLFLALIGPFTAYMKNKPIVEKIGYVPSYKVMKAAFADQKELTAEFLVLKDLVYFGSLIQHAENEVYIPPEYPAMSRLVHNAVELDPYNMDAYYFAQGILSWEIGRIDLANELLERGMQHRTWDWQLPYFAAFNYAYFLKDYEKAAKYYKLAGELSGSDLFNRLAGRYLQEAGRTELAISYLAGLEKEERNPAIKKSYRTRLKAFQEVRRIEIAADKYRDAYGHLPTSIEQLNLLPPPLDPYGGTFYLEPDGKVATTSKFAFVPTEGDDVVNPVQ